MTRTKGAYEYQGDAEEEILSSVTFEPQSTNAITKSIRKTLFSKIKHETVERLLTNLKKRGRIKGFEHGKVKLWQK